MWHKGWYVVSYARHLPQTSKLTIEMRKLTKTNNKGSSGCACFSNKCEAKRWWKIRWTKKRELVTMPKGTNESWVWSGVEWYFCPHFIFHYCVDELCVHHSTAASMISPWQVQTLFLKLADYIIYLIMTSSASLFHFFRHPIIISQYWYTAIQTFLITLSLYVIFAYIILLRHRLKFHSPPGLLSVSVIYSF